MSICPGQDMRKLKAAFYRCEHCGREVEMFSDEYRRRCPHCKQMIEKDALPSCAAWCRAAKDCLGEAAYQEFLRRSGKEEEPQT